MIAQVSTYRTVTPSYTEVELSAMTKAQLLVIADELGIVGVSTKDTKTVIIQAILNA
jgi:hypothetical protein